MLQEIHTADEAIRFASDHPAGALFFFNAATPSGRTARRHLEQAAESADVAAVDATQLRDVAVAMGVRSLPTLVVLQDGRPARQVAGVQAPATYARALGTQVNTPSERRETRLRVTVYTTSSCPHCTTVKNHLRKKGIPFVEVNLTNQPDKAAELQRRTGQTGVPQTNINGTWVLGADIPKIDRLISR